MVSDVSFSVYADPNWQFPELFDPIMFPYVMTNNGGHFDTEESVFTCPINGTYYFSISLYTEHLSNNQLTSAVFMMDEEELSEAYCKNDNTNDLYLQCGTSVVIHCDQGQHVFVTTLYVATQLRGTRKRSTFSGFLIHADIPPYGN